MINAGVLRYPNVSERCILSIGVHVLTAIESNRVVGIHRPCIACPKTDHQVLLMNSHSIFTPTRLGPSYALRGCCKRGYQSAQSPSCLATRVRLKDSSKWKTGKHPAQEQHASTHRFFRFAAYAASKAALNQAMRHMAAELKRKDDDTILLALHPGEVATYVQKPGKLHAYRLTMNKETWRISSSDGRSRAS